MDLLGHTGRLDPAGRFHVRLPRRIDPIPLADQLRVSHERPQFLVGVRLLLARLSRLPHDAQSNGTYNDLNLKTYGNFFFCQGNLISCGVLGSYAVIVPIDHYVGGSLKYIVVNVIRRATVRNFGRAVLDPPFQDNGKAFFFKCV